jgi:hypothetical protein
MGGMLNAMVVDYNKIADELNAEKVEAIYDSQTTVTLPCRISDFMVGSYAKYPETDDHIIMEYAPMSDYLAMYLPS